MSERTQHWMPPFTGQGRLVGRVVWVVFAVILGGIVWMQSTDAFGDHGMANAFSMMAASLLPIVWLLWFLLASGQRWWMRFVPLLVLAGLGFLFSSLFRFEDVSGEFVPRFVRRSAEKPDRELGALAVKPASATVDLVTRTVDDFPQFLGPGRDQSVDHIRLARDWDVRPPKLVWRQSIGAGWGAFSVVNGYAVTMEQRDADENVTCYDARTGEAKWIHTTDARYEMAVSGVGPRTTPTIDSGMVYTQGAMGHLLALDGATGRVVWEKDLLAEFGMSPEQEAVELPYGRSGSPLIVDELVIVPAGGSKRGKLVSLVAYDKRTGDKVWEGGDDQISCSSPAVATVGGVRQILSVNESSASGHEVATGKVLWRHPREGNTAANASVSQAVAVGPNQVFLSKGYALGAALIELLPKGDGTFETREIWQDSKVMRTKFTNVAIKDGFVYGLSDGILECIELATGERQWKGGRYKHGQILRVGDLLLVLAESGEILLIEASPERKNNVLGRFQAIEGKTWNNIALYGSLLLVRNGEEAAAYELALAG